MFMVGCMPHIMVSGNLYENHHRSSDDLLIAAKKLAAERRMTLRSLVERGFAEGAGRERESRGRPPAEDSLGHS